MVHVTKLLAGSPNKCQATAGMGRALCIWPSRRRTWPSADARRGRCGERAR